ncbi:hypothetical protein ACWDWS_41070, partial [Streptomyces sp. NPDC003328]
LLSPIPTFLLWRRMKLWELRSYDQVIKLEQERLVYQARLRSRFGRAWRRKAPVESLMPLRLAKYGVPLMDTTPASPTAADIKPVPVPDTASPVRASAPTQRRGREATDPVSPPAAAQTRGNGIRPTSIMSPISDHLSSQQRIGEEGAEESTDGYLSHARSHRDQLHLASSEHEHDRTVAAGAPPAADKEPEPLLARFPKHATHTGTALSTAKATAGPVVRAGHESGAAKENLGHVPVPTGAHPAREKRPPHVKATIDDRSPHMSTEGGRLTLVDRYYLAWQEYRTQHGDEPTGQKLSAYLADRGLHSRSGKPVSPSTLRRYLLPFRLYTVWAKHREGSSTPALDAIAHDCAAHGITGQYNRPLTIHDISEHTDDFERRWRCLTHHHVNAHQ